MLSFSTVSKKGRPAKGQEPGVVSYAIQGQLASRLDIHARQLQQKSAFIIATNDINESILRGCLKTN